MSETAKNLDQSGTRAYGVRTNPLIYLGFAAVCLLPFALAWNLAKGLPALALGNDSFSQILVVPLVSLFFIYENRRRAFSEISFGWIAGAILVLAGLILVVAARINLWDFRATNQEALFVAGIVLAWLGAFGLFFGSRAYAAVQFPLLFLLFCIPIPEPALSATVRLLQRESANAAELFFRLAGVPYLRQGLIFGLPGVKIQVAEECSGIRSSLALLITTVLASYLFLKTGWKRLLLCAVAIPVAIIKNGLRIAALSILAIYVDPGFLYGNLHHHGGVVFFVIGLVPMALLLIWLQRGEKARIRDTAAVPSKQPA